MFYILIFINKTLLLNMFYLTTRILHLVTHFREIAAEMFQPYSLRLAL